MPQSRVALAESLSDTLASLQTARSGLSNAWALRMSASQKAHFAAVMGNSLTRNCREQGWIVEDALRDDASLVSDSTMLTQPQPIRYSNKPLVAVWTRLLLRSLDFSTSVAPKLQRS